MRKAHAFKHLPEASTTQPSEVLQRLLGAKQTTTNGEVI